MNSEDFLEFKIRISTAGDIEISPASGEYQYCLVFIHGLNHEPLQYVRQFLCEPLKSAIKNCKVVLPRAPLRKMTHHNMTAISWFDILTYEKSFERPFDEAFSSEQIQESGKLITAVVEREAKLLGDDYSKIFLGGFSQGCGMSIHVAHTLPKDIAGVVAIAGYFFEITPLNEKKTFPLLIIHGLSDPLRPWEQVQKSYSKYPGVEKITLVEGMEHEMNTLQTRQHFADFISLHAKL